MWLTFRMVLSGLLERDATLLRIVQWLPPLAQQRFVNHMRSG